jgi:hypothetical protein
VSSALAELEEGEYNKEMKAAKKGSAMRWEIT